MGVHKHLGFNADGCLASNVISWPWWRKTGFPSPSLQVTSTSPGFEANAQEGSAEPLESFTFDRTGQEKGQAPGTK